MTEMLSKVSCGTSWTIGKAWLVLATVSKNHEFSIQNEKLCIKNKELCIKNEKLCNKNKECFSKNDGFCRLRPAHMEHRHPGRPRAGGERSHPGQWSYHVFPVNRSIKGLK